jgi:hypothetical protein
MVRSICFMDEERNTAPTASNYSPQNTNPRKGMPLWPWVAAGILLLLLVIIDSPRAVAGEAL